MIRAIASRWTASQDEKSAQFSRRKCDKSLVQDVIFKCLLLFSEPKWKETCSQPELFLDEEFDGLDLPNILDKNLVFTKNIPQILVEKEDLIFCLNGEYLFIYYTYTIDYKQSLIVLWDSYQIFFCRQSHQRYWTWSSETKTWIYQSLWEVFNPHFKRSKGKRSD